MAMLLSSINQFDHGGKDALLQGRTPEPELFEVLADFVSDVEAKPATGTLRFVERLASRECVVEIELMLAR